MSSDPQKAVGSLGEAVAQRMQVRREAPTSRDKRYIVDIPAYATTTETCARWTAKATLRNVSLGGLFLELPAPPPFDRGELLRIAWRDVVVTAEVRHITCRPGFVGIGAEIREVVTGSILACVDITSDRDVTGLVTEPVLCSDFDVEQQKRARIVQNVLQRAVEVILEFVPAGAEQAAAIRNIAEAAHKCAVGIARECVTEVPSRHAP